MGVGVGGRGQAHALRMGQVDADTPNSKSCLNLSNDKEYKNILMHNTFKVFCCISIKACCKCT